MLYYTCIFKHTTMVSSVNKKLTCPECKNEFDVKPDSAKGDVLECSYCGIELEVMDVDGNGEVSVEVAEEEK